MTREIIAALGRTFRALGMTDHVEHLAAYWRANQGHRQPYAWDDSMVEAWAKRLRVPPYQSALEVRPRNSRCGCGQSRGGRSGEFTVCSWETGSEMGCSGCGRTWLEPVAGN